MGEQRKGKRGEQPKGPALAGGGPSIVGVSGGMRARDVSRAKPEHDAIAAKRLVIRHSPPPPEKT
jgi:hypothetical protein